MRLLEAKVNQHEGYANEPSLMLFVDEIPDRDKFFFEDKVIDDTTFYFAETDGIVLFMAHSPSNENGYGGHVFKTQMRDGTTRDVTGPWSSRAGAMNHYFSHCMDVTLNGMAYAVSISLAKEAAKMAGVEIEMIHRRDDIVYVIKES